MANLIGEIVLEYLQKWQNLPSLTLARKIYAENTEAFTSVEQVRRCIRYYRGARGSFNRKALKDITYAKEWNKFQLPESDGEDYDPFHINGENKMLVFSDLHLPYHDVEALTKMFDYAKDREYTSILINGDFWDFHQLSYFMKDPRKRRVRQELDEGKLFFTRLREVFPTQKIYFKLGNHEERWENYLKTKAPELFDISEFHLENLFPFLDLGIETISDKRIIKAGKLNILHGHELKINAVNVNPARTTFLKTYDSTLIGHSHRSSEHTEANLNGETLTCWSVGCMCWLHPHYAPINRWVHGFASVKIHSDNTFNVKNLKIIEGEVR